jgi:hypothetical protein
MQTIYGLERCSVALGCLPRIILGYVPGLPPQERWREHREHYDGTGRVNHTHANPVFRILIE